MRVQALFQADPDARQPCWVRVTRRREDGFVEFDFALGDPELCVDLILPQAAFEEFCRDNHARQLSSEQARELDQEQAKWRYGKPGAHE